MQDNSSISATFTNEQGENVAKFFKTMDYPNLHDVYDLFMGLLRKEIVLIGEDRGMVVRGFGIMEVSVYYKGLLDDLQYVNRKGIRINNRNDAFTFYSIVQSLRTNKLTITGLSTLKPRHKQKDKTMADNKPMTMKADTKQKVTIKTKQMQDLLNPARRGYIFAGPVSNQEEIFEFNVDIDTAGKLQNLITSLYSRQRVVTSIDMEPLTDKVDPITGREGFTIVQYTDYVATVRIKYIIETTVNNYTETEEKNIEVQIPMGPNTRPIPTESNYDLIKLLLELCSFNAKITSVTVEYSK